MFKILKLTTGNDITLARSFGANGKSAASHTRAQRFESNHQQF